MRGLNNYNDDANDRGMTYSQEGAIALLNNYLNWSHCDRSEGRESQGRSRRVG